MQKAQHLLVIRMSAMGDVAMTVPVIKTLTHQYPNLKITVVSRGFLKPLFDDITNVNFYTADLNAKHKGLKGIYKLFKELKQLNFDAVADLHDVLRSKTLRSLFKTIGVKTAYINKGRNEKKALTAINNKVFKQLKTTHHRYADVFKSLGYHINLNKAQPKSKEVLPSSITNLINHNSKDTIIGIAPFAAHEGKKYPLHLMEQVITELSKQYKILLFGGGKQEIEALTKLGKKYNNCFCIAGKVKLKEELAIISNLSTMISMDSGNGHFSAIYGIPTISIWGATHPFAGFTPFNQSQNCIIANRNTYPLLPTSIYGNKIIPGYEKVMDSIHPQIIINKVLSIIH